MNQRRKLLSPKGFTLIELLVVIGVIGILVAMAIMGFRAMDRGGRANDTRARLANAAGMFAEYETATALRRQPPSMWDATVPTSVRTPPGTTFNIWRDADPTTAGEQPLNAPRRVVEVGTDLDRTESQAVRNTAIVMRELERVPGVRKMITQLPGDARMAEPVAGEPNATVLLDGWRNPIIFVPAAGLGEVYLGTRDAPITGSPFTITTVRPYATGELTATATPPNVRPFFASAGPDGAFGFIDANGNGTFDLGTDIPAGDDNIYSFEN